MKLGDYQKKELYNSAVSKIILLLQKYTILDLRMKFNACEFIMPLKFSICFLGPNDDIKNKTLTRLPTI